MRIGIRREDKSRWERRAPLSPEAILELRSLSGAHFVVQPSTIRIFPDTAYLAAGAEVGEDLRECDILFAVKEIPLEMIHRGKVLLFFSHTIKGQSHNMGLLRRMVEQETTLIDYERIVDDTNRRLVFFGRHAGYAGMLDGLAALTGRLAMEGLESPLDAVRNAWQYDSLDAARHELRAIGKRIREEGMGRELGPVVIGFTGFGNVSKGAQSILAELPVEPLDPEKLATLHEGPWSDRVIYSVELAQKDMFRRRDGGTWNEERYWSTPAEYESNMDRVLPHLLMLVNGILWTADYPRLVSRDLLANLYAEAGGKPRLRSHRRHLHRHRGQHRVQRESHPLR
jgi:saccharopine dehydrogenase (NAD+, L-lysine-forming)